MVKKGGRIRRREEKKREEKSSMPWDPPPIHSACEPMWDERQKGRLVVAVCEDDYPAAVASIVGWVDGWVHLVYQSLAWLEPSIREIKRANIQILMLQHLALFPSFLLINIHVRLYMLYIYIYIRSRKERLTRRAICSCASCCWIICSTFGWQQQQQPASQQASSIVY